MKKIINGKKYDTETAVLIKKWDNRLPQNDFDYRASELYRKKTGEFFEAYETYLSKGITPLSEEIAKQMAERHLDGDEYEAIFGIVEE